MQLPGRRGPLDYSRIMAKITALTQDLCRYMLRNCTPEDSVLADLRRATRERVPDYAGMMVSKEQGAMLRLLVSCLAPTLAIEVGTFTGYSSACIASALPEGSTLLCCDLNEEWTSIGKPFWELCGVADRIDLRIGSALGTLRALPAGTVADFAFVDADKDNYVAYYEELLPRMRRNALLAFDNVLWHNWAMDAANQDPETVGIREFNDHVLRDERVESVMIHIGDGMTLVRKR